MDPFTLALATFGVQKLRGKSTRTAFKDAALIGGTAYGIGALAPQSSIGQMFAGKPAFSSMQALPFLGQTPAVEASEVAYQAGNTTQQGGNLFSRLLGKKGLTDTQVAALKEQGVKVTPEMIKGSGIMGLDTGTKLAIGAAALPLLEGEEEGVKPQFTEEDYKKAYDEQSAKLEGKFMPGSSDLPSNVFGSNMFYANEGGLATAIPHYNTGGVNYLPSKIEKDEHDYSNYERAKGYVEDATGAGDKDEDTMLAQLADGEFVSRADAVLGAVIMSGASPSDFRGMRKAGADFFYNQQKNLKRIYDITNGAKESKN